MSLTSSSRHARLRSGTDTATVDRRRPHRLRDGRRRHAAATAAAAPTTTVTVTAPAPPAARRRRSRATPAPQLPVVRITGHPASTVKTKKSTARVTFKFSSSANGASFKCSRDFGAFSRCTSPTSYSAKVGKHTFAVEAVAAGLTGPPVTRASRSRRPGSSSLAGDLRRVLRSRPHLMAGSSGFHWVRAAHSAGMVSAVSSRRTR